MGVGMRGLRIAKALQSDMPTRTACLLMAAALALPLGRLSAEEIALQCDPMNSEADPIVLSIDTSKHAAHIGEEPDSGWFLDGNQYKYKSGSDEPDKITGRPTEHADGKYYWDDDFLPGATACLFDI